MEKIKVKENEIKNKTKNIINKQNILKGINKFINSIAFPVFIGVLLLLKTIFFYESTISIREIINKEVIIGGNLEESITLDKTVNIDGESKTVIKV